MKTKMLPLLVMVLFAITQHLHAQSTCGLYEVPLSQRIDQATLIVEAKVLSSESFQLNPDEIFTRHRLEVFKLLKGSLPSEIEVITYGGEVNGLRQTYTNLLTLRPGEQGVFFLIPSLLVPSAYQAYASSQGVVKYVSDDLGNITGQEPFHHYRSVEQEVFQAIEGQTGQDRVSLMPTDYERRLTDWLTRKGLNTSVRSDGPTLIYGFANPVLTGPASEFLDFEVYARTLWGSFEFGESAIYLDYNPQVFGPNVVANGKISVSKGDLILSTAYTLNISDETPSQVKIEIDATPGSLEDIGMAADEVLHLSVEIGNAFQNPEVYFEEGLMQGNSSFYELVTQTFEPFSYVFAEDSLYSQFGTSAADILDFNPKVVAAGIDDTITIRGEDFGPQREGIVFDGRVQFTRQYEGASGGVTQIWYEPLDSDYLLWPDTLIRVLVPSNVSNDSINTAATGDIRVRKRDIAFATRSDTPLTISFALRNQVVPDGAGENISVPVQLIDHDSLGGYLLRYGSSFLVDNGAVNAFERALINWRCTSQIRLTRNDTITVTPFGPQPSIIEFFSLPVGAVTTLARTLDTREPCSDASGGEDIFVLKGFRIRFNSNLTWHTDVSDSIPAGQFDLESRALHELGHVHQLFHVNNSADLMYFTSLTPTRRIIQPNDEAEGLHQVLSWSAPALAAGYACAAHVPVPLAECDSIHTSVEDYSSHVFDWNVFPNPTDDLVHIELQSNRPVEVHATLLDLQGRTLQSHSFPILSNYQFDISTANFSPGIYFLFIQTGDQYQSIKIQVQH